MYADDTSLLQFNEVITFASCRWEITITQQVYHHGDQHQDENLLHFSKFIDAYSALLKCITLILIDTIEWSIVIFSCIFDLGESDIPVIILFIIEI